jgi:peptide/nickel transport system permease protein
MTDASLLIGTTREGAWTRVAKRVRRNRTLRRTLRNRPAFVSLCFLGLLTLVAIFGTLLMPDDPAKQSLLEALQKPSGKHWLGTDPLGRDILSRLIEGTRVSLLASLQAIGIGVVFGIPTGLAAGYLGRTVDTVVSWVMNTLLALPPLILALAIVGFLGPGLRNAMIAIGVVLTPRFFRVARAAGQTVRNETYIEANRAMGCSTARILFRHVLPNASGALLVQVTFALGSVIIAEASLSFVGLGAKAPTASWGSMVRDGFNAISQGRWAIWPPSIMIVLTIWAFTTLGDALRDAVGRQARVGD